uniref:FAD/NAD(P)-binding domain-containing protein n=1 Tax=Acrobeloides nanus TaxID=290746 RepID=A0A914DAI5_9BILA
IMVDEFNEAIYLVATIGQVRQTKVVPKFEIEDKDKFLEKHTIVVGSGPAALTCIETLRKEGWGYPITMVTKEDTYPYDRQLLSKSYYSNDEGISIRDESFFNQVLVVSRWLKTPVNSIDYTKKTFIHDNDPEHPSDFQNLVLAMGAEPKKLQVPGADLSGIHYFRTIDDAIKIYNETVYKDNVDEFNLVHVCIIGSELLGIILFGQTSPTNVVPNVTHECV